MKKRSRWDDLAELLAEAGEVAPPERETFLRGKTSDAALRREVMSLLAVGMLGGDPLEGAAVDWYRPEPELTEPAVTAPRLMTGEIVGGRFRVEAFLGRGGMGEVYAAEDRELCERVALKLLDPELARQPGFLGRFRREIRLARRISHPNVARVFDLVQEPAHPLGGLYFCILELLDGETLRARLKRAGPLNDKEALEVARQIAAGLAAVHAAGVIHRDLKPANVMLTEGRAVVTDFGLAAPMVREKGQAALQTTSLLMGTPGYVAPEQWAGKPASVKTDVYSFGIVLHEMVTGRHPNEEGTQLKGEWGRVISKCLEMDPERRWKNPVDAVKALQAFRVPRRHLVYAGGVAAVASLGGYSLTRMTSLTLPKAGAKLLVAEISNTTGDARYDAVGTALRMHLDQSTFFNVVQKGEVALTLTEMLVFGKAAVTAVQFREAAWRMHAAAVVFGSFALLGAAPNLTLQLEWRGKQPQEPSGRETKSFAARSWGDVSQTVREAGNWVRSSVGDASLGSAIYDRMPEQVTTPSWEALLFFARAEEHAYNQRHEEALLELESALRADAGFSFAAMRRADILNSMGRDLDSMLAWEQAMKLLRARPVSRREELRTVGMYYFDTHSFKESEDQFARFSYEYPNDARGYFYRSTQMLLDGRARELVPLLKKAAELDNRFFPTYTALGQVGVSLNQAALFDGAMTRLSELGKQQYVHLGQTTRGWFAGDLDGVLKQSRALQKMASPRFSCEGGIQEGNVYAEAGLYVQAGGCFERAAGGLKEALASESQSRALAGLGYCLVAMGQMKGARAVASKIVDIHSSVTGFCDSANLLALSAAVPEARKMLARLESCPDVPKTRVAMHLAESEIARAENKMADYDLAMERAFKYLPRFGYHSCFSISSGIEQHSGADRLAAAPLFFWQYTQFARPGWWGRRIRQMRGVKESGDTAGRQLTTFTSALASLK